MSTSRDRHPQFSFGLDPNAGPGRARRSTGRAWKIALAAGLLAALGGGYGYLYVYEPATLRAALGDTPLSPAPVTRAYKWRSADGSWQLSDRPPPAGTPYETVEARTDVNILPAGAAPGASPRTTPRR